MNADIELRCKVKMIMEKSRNSLRLAKQLHHQSFYNDAASKAYYSVFHSLQAILLTLGLSFSKHSSVIASFNKEFIHKKIFPKDFYRNIERLFRDRQIGDYGYNENVSFDDSEQDVADAETIINAIEKYLKKGSFFDA